jgi:hypothetical protein
LIGCALKLSDFAGMPGHCGWGLSKRTEPGLVEGREEETAAIAKEQEIMKDSKRLLFTGT